MHSCEHLMTAHHHPAEIACMVACICMHAMYACVAPSGADRMIGEAPCRHLPQHLNSRLLLLRLRLSAKLLLEIRHLLHMGVYTCVCTWVCVHGCVYMGVYMCMCTCVCVHVCVHMYVYVYVYVYVYMCMCTCVGTCVCVHVCVCVREAPPRGSSPPHQRACADRQAISLIAPLAPSAAQPPPPQPPSLVSPQLQPPSQPPHMPPAAHPPPS